MTSGPDLILGVSRAADTAKQREAAARLERLSRSTTNAAAAAAPAGEVPSAWPVEVRVASAGTAAAPMSTVSVTRSNADGAGAPADAYVQFEALLLQNMVETMMPKDSEAMFGSGTAGTIWKSMLAEKVAMEIARSGTLGIAKQIAAGEGARSAAVAPPKVKDV